MREILVEAFGGPDVLTLHHDRPVPTPGPGELLVEVDFAGLNPLDFKIRDGSSAMAAQVTPPMGTGREMVGVVRGAGPDLDETELAARGLSVGTRVFGMRSLDDLRGTLAEVVVMRADDLAPVPSEVTAEQLPLFGGLSLAGLTALAAVHDAAEVHEGDTVLVHGGAGGVGQLIVPIARAAGASQVWATGRAANAERIRALGAEPIAHDETDWIAAIRQATGGRGVDVILDTHYHSTFVPSLDVLAEGGRIVALPSLADLSPAEQRGITARIPRIRGGRDRMDQLVAMWREGLLDLEVSQILPLAEAARGHRLLEEGHTRGKLIVDVRA